MSRNCFLSIKSNLHVCNNHRIHRSTGGINYDPWLIWRMKSWSSFGVFTKDISTDEQMIPYFQRHTCKMSIRGKIKIIFFSDYDMFIFIIVVLCSFIIISYSPGKLQSSCNQAVINLFNIYFHSLEHAILKYWQDISIG